LGILLAGKGSFKHFQASTQDTQTSCAYRHESNGMAATNTSLA